MFPACIEMATELHAWKSVSLEAMRSLEKQIAQIEASHWIILTRDLSGDWMMSIWGPYPLSGNFGLIQERDAKERAFAIAKQHLARHGVQVEAASVSDLRWRVSVRQMVA